MSTCSTSAIGRKALPGAMVFQNYRASGLCTVDRLATDEITFIGQPPADLTPGAVTVVLTVAECRLVRLKGFFRYTDIDARGSQCWRVALQHTSRDVEDKIQQMIVDQFERARVPLVIVLDRGRLSRTRLRRDLHRLGRDVVLFDNALEALWFMDDSPDRFSTLVVDFSFVSAQGSEAISFLRDRWPEKRCLLSYNPELVGKGEIQALQSSVHGVLKRPWTQTSLETALGLLPAGPVASPRRILFVDDEPALLQALQHRMRKYLALREP